MSLARKALLAMSTNAWLRDRATRTAFVRRSVSTFMPGERLDDAIVAAKAQEQLGIRTIFTKLGENLTRVEEAEEVTQHYLDVLDKVQAQQLQVQVSVKPTQLGLDLDRELCYRNLQRLVDRAAARGNFIWIDMERFAVRRSNDRPVPPHARAVAFCRHRPAGVSVPNRAGHRGASAAWLGDPNGQRRVPRTTVGRLSEEERCRREFLHAVVPPA
jgi:hypothetical protein